MNMSTSEMKNEFFSLLAEPFSGEMLFDQFIDIVFFIKNAAGQYVIANQTLVERLGLKEKKAVIGRTSDEVFPNPQGQEYRKQDEYILQMGEPFLNQLELHAYPSGYLGWCLTNKVPLFGKDQQVVGLAGISKDLNVADKNNKNFSQVAKVVSHIKSNFAEPLKLDDLAEIAALSTYQFEQRMQSIFHLTAGQFIQKIRMDAAIWKLRKTDDSLVNIAMDCGYGDQSAFSRKFKQTTGLSPGQYRKIAR
jgi:AraC-like DNA-binding protein